MDIDATCMSYIKGYAIDSLIVGILTTCLLYTSQQIQSAMDNLMKGRTSFIIAHRLSDVYKRQG